MSATARVGGFKRALSESEIRSCENAREDKCVCRCKGKLHGKGRIAADAARSAFEALPIEDPHHLPTKQEAKKIAKLRKAIRVAHARHGRTKTAGTYRLLWYADEEVCPLCLEEGKPIPPVGYECKTCDVELRKNGDTYEHTERIPSWHVEHEPRPFKRYVVEWEEQA